MMKGKDGCVVILYGRKKFQNENVIELTYNKITYDKERKSSN